MEWTDIRLTVAKADADNAEAVATMIAEGGIYIEDYSDIEQQVAEIAHVDLIEQELLAAINALGIGPQGFGGKTTCLGLAIEQMPTHVAGLPVAVNVSCHVTRRASAEL